MTHLDQTVRVPREFRKTATIMAVQYLGQHVDGVCTGGSSCQSRGAPDDAVPHIHTLEGDLTVSHGDWIATGVQGEHWAIKPDVFAATYALAAAPSPEAKDETKAEAALWKAHDERLASLQRPQTTAPDSGLVDSLVDALKAERDWHDLRADLAFDEGRECSHRGETADEEQAMKQFRGHSERVDAIDEALAQARKGAA